MRRAVPWLMLPCLAASPAIARTLTVGEGATPTLADAVRTAADGDTIHLPAGTRYECAVLPQRGLVLEGEGDGTVLTDTTCEGKALLVVRGDRLTVRNLVLARARVPDGNGAGIRLEGQGLTLDHVRFRNNEVGVLAAAGGPGAVLVRDCVFEAGGRPAPGPTAALMAGPVALLQVDRTVFTGVTGAQVATAAGRTVLAATRMEVGAGPGAGAAVQAGGGALVMNDDVLVLGPDAPPRGAAVVATAGTLELRGNQLQNGTRQPATLLLNWTGTDAVLANNQVAPGDTEEGTGGVWRHRVGGVARAAVGGARSAAGAAKRAMSRLFGG